MLKKHIKNMKMGDAGIVVIVIALCTTANWF
jgi:hypothetical protein